jgi:hypothetical protein
LASVVGARAVMMVGGMAQMFEMVSMAIDGFGVAIRFLLTAIVFHVLPNNCFYGGGGPDNCLNGDCK